MYKITVMTAWTGNGQTAETAYRPKVADTYSFYSWVDSTGKYFGQVALYKITAFCTPTVLAAIQADSTYKSSLVILSTP